MKPYKDINPSKTSLTQIDFKSGQLFRGEGFLKYDDLPRIHSEIKSRSPDFQTDMKGVQWQIETIIDEIAGGGSEYRLHLNLAFKYPLECQRCLEVFEDELKVSSQFVLQNTQEEVDNFPLDNDDEDALLNSHHFDLIELFEDEILLNLPLIPKHELKDCGSKDIVVMGVLAKDSLEIPSEEDQNTPSNPFARLKNLKFDA